MKERHAPREYLPRTDTAVLLLHGFAGSPSHFDFLLPLIERRGYAYRAPLLAGHGQGSRAFARSGIADWRAQVADELAALTAQYPRVLIATHSMGGLLALDALQSERAHGLFCLALPLHLKVGARMLKIALAVAFAPSSELARTAHAVRGVGTRSVFSYLLWLPGVFSLARYAGKVRALSAPDGVPVLCVFSARDELVSRRSAAAANAAFQTVVLGASTHFTYPGDDKAEIERLFTRFLAGPPSL